MGMTPIEMIDFFDSQYEKSKSAITSAKSKDNYYLVAFNYADSFKCKMMQLLISWRINVGNPKEYITTTIEIAKEALEALHEMGTKNIIQDFPLQTALILSYLANSPFEVPEYNPKGLELERLLDFEMFKTLQSEDNEVQWTYILSNKKPTSRTKLCYQTYELYKEILFNKDSARTEPLVKQAEELFLKRADNSYYSNVGTEGGGFDNDITVDYHLGAILKYIDYKSESIHKWSFD